MLKKKMQIASIDADSILGLADNEQNKGNLKLLLRYNIRQFNSENAKDSDDGGSSWYSELHDHLESIH